MQVSATKGSKTTCERAKLSTELNSKHTAQGEKLASNHALMRPPQASATCGALSANLKQKPSTSQCWLMSSQMPRNRTHNSAAVSSHGLAGLVLVSRCRIQAFGLPGKRFGFPRKAFGLSLKVSSKGVRIFGEALRIPPEVVRILFEGQFQGGSDFRGSVSDFPGRRSDSL